MKPHCKTLQLLIRISTVGMICAAIAACSSPHAIFVKATPSDWQVDHQFSAKYWKRFAPPTNEEIVSEVTLWGTYYLTPTYRYVAGGVPLVSRSGEALGPRIAGTAFCDVANEGALMAQMSVGSKLRTFTYDGYDSGSESLTDCTRHYAKKLQQYQAGNEKENWPVIVSHFERTRFRASDTPYGNAGTSRWLVPWRTVATDNSVFPPGTLFYIPQARGTRVLLPSGQTVIHDGYFFGADSGGAIKVNHIDFFTGLIDPRGRSLLPRIGGPEAPFKAYIVASTTPISIMKGLHRMD